MKALFMVPAVWGLAMTAMAEEKWTLIWSDEFNYSGAPDPVKWGYEEGMIRNRESQTYTRRPENVRVENGLLILEARREKFPNFRYVPGSSNYLNRQRFARYTSASIHTMNFASWTYGRIEVRAKIPAGSGTWPAIWTMGLDQSNASPFVGKNWPACGEIDIMEHYGIRPHEIASNLHYQKNNRHDNIRSRQLALDKPYDDFHIYATEWYPDRIDFFFDNLKYASIPLKDIDDPDTAAFHKPHYLLLSFALGSFGGPINDSLLPSQFLVDYVRVYQQKEILALATTQPSPPLERIPVE